MNDLELPSYAMTADLTDMLNLPESTIICWAGSPGEPRSHQTAILRKDDVGETVLQIGDNWHSTGAIHPDAFPVWVVWMPPTDDTAFDAETYEAMARVYSSPLTDTLDCLNSERERALELAVEWGGKVDAHVDAMMAAAERFAQFLTGNGDSKAAN